MNLIRNIVRLTANRYKNARFSTVFLTITLILSMFVISVATSFVAQILQAQDAKKKAMPPHGMAVNFYCEGEEEFKVDALKNMLSVAKSGQIIRSINEYNPKEWLLKILRDEMPLPAPSKSKGRKKKQSDSNESEVEE